MRRALAPLFAGILVAGCSQSADTTSTVRETTTGAVDASVTSVAATTSSSSTTTEPPTTTTTTLAFPDGVVINFDEGVSDVDREAITDGVAIAHNYAETTLGGDEAATWTDGFEGNPLTATVHASGDMGCCTAGSFIPGAPFPNDFLLGPVFNVGDPTWNTGAAPLFIRHRKDSAHEYAHAWQGALGCGGGGHGDPLGRWLSEGMAEYIGWNSLVEAGRVTEEEFLSYVLKSVSWDANNDPVTPDLAAWEGDDQTFGSQGYFYSLLATTRLVNEYGGPMVLRDLCEETARLTQASGFPYWPNMAVAFDNLGIDRDRFYADMAEYFDQVPDRVSTGFPWATGPVGDYFLQFLLEPNTGEEGSTNSSTFTSR